LESLLQGETGRTLFFMSILGPIILYGRYLG
jgi:hypothetical protein